MARVIYNWHVTPNNQESFIAAWKAATNTIHQSVPGAKGSFMLKNIENQMDIKTVAKWDSLEDWKAFWDNRNSTQMQSMHLFGKLISTEKYLEVDDYTQ